MDLFALKVVERIFFFHYSDLIDVELFDLDEGDKVCFELGENDRGSCARRVMRCS